MPNYDIIPMAADLLDYTIQRVKTVEPEYKPVSAYVMENGQLVQRTLYQKVRGDGKPHFPKSQTFPKARLSTCAPVWRTVPLTSWSGALPPMTVILRRSMRNGSKTWTRWSCCARQCSPTSI